MDSEASRFRNEAKARAVSAAPATERRKESRLRFPSLQAVLIVGAVLCALDWLTTQAIFLEWFGRANVYDFEKNPFIQIFATRYGPFAPLVWLPFEVMLAMGFIFITYRSKYTKPWGIALLCLLSYTVATNFLVVVSSA